VTDLGTLVKAIPSVSGWLRHPAIVAAAGFLVIRLIGLLALLFASERQGRPLIGVLGIWDGGWYVRIAEEGYADRLDLSAPMIDQSTGSLAFFPAYPILMRMVSGLTGLDPRWAGVLISVIAGMIAAAGIAVLAGDWAGRRVGVLAALLWAAAPMAVVCTLVYSEATFTALTVWTFVALRWQFWLLAGILGAAAGLTRPTGVAVGAAVAAYAVWTCWQRLHPPTSATSATSATGDPQHQGTGLEVTSRDRSQGDQPFGAIALPLVAGGLALAGTPAFWLGVGVRADRWDAWFAMQDAFWGSRFDGGASMFVLAKSVVSGTTAPGIELMSAVVVLALLGALVLLVLAFRARVWWPLFVYAALSLVMVIGGAGYFSSKLRFLIPIFVLAFPVARWLGGRSRVLQAIVVLAATAATTVSGTWLLLYWPYAI